MDSQDLNNTNDVKEITSERHRTKSESYAFSKIIRKSSEQFSSIENLEDLLTCPIHLGVIDEPRQLQCGHAFCLSCLESYMSHSLQPNNSTICCPLCRVNTQLDRNGIHQLAPSYLHKQLTDYLFTKKKRVLNTSLELSEVTSENNDNIFSTKVQLMSQLLKDIKNQDISLDCMSPESNKDFILNLQSILDQQELRRGSTKLRIRSKSVLVSERKDLTENTVDNKFHSLDQNTIRKNMRKYREYTLAKHFSHHIDNSVIGIAWITYSSSSDIANDIPTLIYIIKDSPLIYLANAYGLKILSFIVDIDNVQLEPIYVKSHLGMIFVSGKIGSEQQSCLTQLSLDGKKVKLTKKYPGILGGFCFDFTNNSIFVAYPTKHQVLLIDESLQNELKVFEFGDLSPMFVAISRKTREVWVSCPDNGRIAVYDEMTNNYLHLATNQIYDSTPTHIIETYDHRLLFLDVGKSRLFWIFRWNNCLYIQLLLVMGATDDLKINTIESISDNMILFSDGQKTFMAKPNRSPKDEHQKIKCSIL